MELRKVAAIAGGLAACLAGGALCVWLRTPLPWMIGPLGAMALVQFGGASLEAPPFGREAGQTVIAVTLGLYFTPVVAREVIANAPLLAVAALGVFGVGLVASLILAKAARVDPATAFFSTAIGGAAEMVNLGERNGALVDRVALAHSLRLLIVVSTVPIGITLLGQTGTVDYRPVAVPFDAGGLVLLAAVGIAAAFAWKRTGLPNAFMMGPLITTIAITASGHSLTSMPTWMSNAAQLLLACSLGSRFQQSFLREAPRFVAATVATIVFMIGTLALFSMGLAWATGGLAATLMLACSPGGIAEMAITAKVLRVGVAFVTAAHVMRFAIVVLATEPTFLLLKRLARK